MVNFSESGHPIFRASSGFERGEVRRKARGKTSKQFNELLLRTVISANQLSVHEAVADLYNELSEGGVRASEQPDAPDHLEPMEIPAGPSNSETPTNAQQQENLVQEYGRRFEHLSEDQKLSKLRSDAGLKLVERGQSTSILLVTEDGQKMQRLCREYTMPRNEKMTRARGWILKNTVSVPVLGAKVCHRGDRYSIEVLVESLFQDRTASWIRIVKVVDKYLTQEEEDIASRKPFAKARPRQKPTVTRTPVSIPVRGRRWTDIETQRSNGQKCVDVSKAITRLLRHDQTVHRDIDGAIQHNDIIEECRKKKLDGASQWSLEEWKSTLAKGGGAKKRFQYCLNPNSSNQFLYLRATHRTGLGTRSCPRVMEAWACEQASWKMHSSDVLGGLRFAHCSAAKAGRNATKNQCQVGTLSCSREHWQEASCW